MEKKTLLDRVLPVIGDNYEKAHILCFNPDLTGVIADIVARMGGRSSLVADHWVNRSRYQFNNDLLQDLRDEGYMFAAHAWQRRIHEHLDGHGHPQGQLIVWPQDLYADEDPPYTLVVGGGNYMECAIALHYARRHKLPCIVGAVCQGHSVAYLSHPDMFRVEMDWVSEADRFLKALNKVPVVYDHLRVGELLDCFGWFTKGCIMNGDEERRSEWFGEILRNNLTLIIRGTPASPYQIWWNRLRYTQDFSGDSWYIPPREEILKDKNVWVIGCGTGSLFIQECLPLISNLTLVDCKPFSRYNPVRQMMGVKHIDKSIKSLEMLDEIARRWDSIIEGDWKVCAMPDEEGSIFWERYTDLAHGRSVQGIVAQPQLEFDMNQLIDKYGTPDLVVLATGMTTSDNHQLANALRKKKIPHIIPSALPAALYHKIIVCTGDGPCYSCLQGRQSIDQQGPDMPLEARELFYGGTQPATMFETYPSARALLRVAVEVLTPPALRSRWFVDLVSQEYTCLLWGNEVQKSKAGEGNLYNVCCIGELVAFGVENMVGWPACHTCGRLNGVGSTEPCKFCGEKARMNQSEYCSHGHATLALMEQRKAQQEADALLHQPLDVLDLEDAEES